MIHVSIDGKSGEFLPGIPLSQALEQLSARSAAVLGCISGGVVYELNKALCRDVELKTLTYADDEGRRIYERSLRFLMLMAARHIWPGLTVRIEHSLGYGLYVSVIGHQVTTDETRALNQEMRRLCRAALPYRQERWSRARAIEYFKSTGQQDKVRLLSYRPYQHIYMYTCGEMSEYFYGKMLPGTWYTKVFSVKLSKRGFILQMPKPDQPERIS